MSEKKLFESLTDIQKDLSTVINKMKLLSLNDAFVTHCDFILNNLTILKAVSALKIAVQSYNVYQKSSDEQKDTNNRSNHLLNESAVVDYFDNDDDNYDVNDISESLESSTNERIKKEVDDDADYDPKEDTGYVRKVKKRTLTMSKKVKGKRGTKSRRAGLITKTDRGLSIPQNDPSIQIEYR